MNITLRYGLGSLIVATLVFAAKWWAYAATHSTLLFADAAETTINVAGAALALFALRLSQKPPDANHPYGHNKIEYISAAIEGSMMVVAALVNGREAVLGWLYPSFPEHPTVGLMLNGAAGAVNLLWGILLLRVGRRHHSPALVGSGKHVLSDVWTTIAVLGGFGLVSLTGWLRVEPVLTMLIALGILKAAYETLRGAVGALMDEVPDEALVPIITRVIGAHARGAHEAHDLRARVVGATTFVEFHLVVPGTMLVEEAHDICDRIEDALKAELGRSVIHIHTEPTSKAKGRNAVWRSAQPIAPAPAGAQ